MARRSEFVDWLVEQLAPLGRVRARAMFGGFGLYFDNVFFGLVDDDVLYLKADSLSKPRFVAAGCRPFSYRDKRGRTIELSFFQLPNSALDDDGELADWVRGAADTAVRAQAGARRKARK